jgi:multiple sugar transport system substrate-binding protein
MGYDEQRQKTLIAVGAGEGPDIVQVDTIWLGEFADGDIIIDLSEYYANWEGREDIPESFLESSQWEGKYYGVWLNSDVRFLVWEKEALRAAGLDPEVAPQTWEELIANAQQAQNPPETWGFAFPAFSTDHTADRWYPFLWQSGGDILTEDFSQAAFNSEAGVQALQFLSDLINVHEVTPPDILTISNSDLTTAIDQGRYVYAIRVGPGANADRFQGDPELFQELRGVGHLPIPAGGEQATGSGGWLLGITRDSEHPDLAWEYITLVTDPDNAAPFWKANGMVPTRTSALSNIEEYEASFPYFELVAEAVQFTHFRPAIPEYPELSTHIVQAIQRTLAQEATAQEALDEAAAAVNELLSGGE